MKVVISQVNDSDRDKLHYLTEMGIAPGVKILVLEVLPFDGPLSLKIGEKSLILSRAMARRIYVNSIE